MAVDRNPRALKNWCFRCQHCTKTWGRTPDGQVKEIREHMLKEHGLENTTVDLVWIGRGPAPKTAPTWN